ncbi:helix-turn-helix domain-containing protein [Gordonia sp. TBRC 11910]|uniref:Helix-turn-helix domain-containing protein n=1 Tax=Gordonia asplenii TaxID=2725283 RepID=A0A848L6D1_9ACTN|nr:helix-turn-helix transcriptional regulator [Gordonia asplenii]NMO04091.1 helix-turn-helix domain-containing protein [Gordonia asplenii]
MIDRTGLAAFLRRRREALQPEDVGLPRGRRRRTRGLRREEVATLCHMSADYYSRLEQERGPHPSEQMIAAIAQGLHLTRDERDHLYRLAGHQPPSRAGDSEFISPGMMRIFDRLTDDTAAEIVSELGETLRQTRLSVALMGDMSQYVGASRSIGYRWFTDPHTRERYPIEDHEFYSRMYASGLRTVLAQRGPDSRAAELADLLTTQSPEFAEVWEKHEVGIVPRQQKRLLHPGVGPLDLHCQILLDPEQSNTLLVYTAVPGSESYQRLALLAAVGDPASF